jgi:hypothetical protein
MQLWTEKNYACNFFLKSLTTWEVSNVESPNFAKRYIQVHTFHIIFSSPKLPDRLCVPPRLLYKSLYFFVSVLLFPRLICLSLARGTDEPRSTRIALHNDAVAGANCCELHGEGGWFIGCYFLWSDARRQVAVLGRVCVCVCRTLLRLP